MTTLSYDKILVAPVGNKRIRYGILFGNEKTVFIKAGANGDIPGYQGKYLKMAHRIHARIGATVICASNPDTDERVHLKKDRGLIEKIIADCGFDKPELYFAGTSDGGYLSLLLAQQFSQTAKHLGINATHKGIADFAERIQSLPHVKKILVYGTEDEESRPDIPIVRSLTCDNLEIILLDGIDHDFTGHVDDFIALIDLL